MSEVYVNNTTADEIDINKLESDLLNATRKNDLNLDRLVDFMTNNPTQDQIVEFFSIEIAPSMASLQAMKNEYEMIISQNNTADNIFESEQNNE